MLTGKHLIAGDWIDGDATFENMPVSGAPDTFSVGTVDLVDRACDAAEAAFRQRRRVVQIAATQRVPRQKR